MICVDASVAVQSVLIEDHSDNARQLLADARRADERLVAPHLFRFELTNTVRQRMVRFGLPLEDARGLIARLIALPVTLLGADALHPRALEIADAHGLAAAYDAHYVALAELLACDLWTADERLMRSLGGRFPFVRWLGTYPAS